MNHQIITVVLSISLLVFACKKDPEPPEFTVPDSSYGLIYDKILTPSCGISGCHDGASVHPRLSGENTYQSMITDHVHDHDANHAGLHLIDPGSPENSFLYQKVIYDSSEYKFGSPMPQGGLTISKNQINFLRQWIAVGAPETGHVADRSLVE